MLKLEELMSGTTKEAAYVLGFLWGDGFIRCKPGKTLHQYITGTEIVSVDMVEIKNIFDSLGDWTFSERHRKNRQPQSCLYSTNKILGKYLIDNGYGPNTTGSANSILLNTNPEYHNYWFRGLIDADGCYYYNKKQSCRQFSLVSCYEQEWNFFTNKLDELNIQYALRRRIEYPNSPKPQKHSIVRITNIDDIELLGQYLYGKKYDALGLSRKYNKWLEISNSRINRSKRGGRQVSNLSD